jgi:hypothetical protein
MKPEQQRDQGQWSAPEYVKVESIKVVEHDRLPIDEGVVKDIMATIGGGDVSALPPVHLWRRQPNADPTLVAGRNRLEAHKRSGREAIFARVITGEAEEIIHAVQLMEIDENLNRRELSPAIRLTLTKQRKALYEEKYTETKRGSAGGRAKADKGAKSQNATEQPPAFIDVQAKQTGRHRATIARELSEARKIGDAAMKKIVGTSLDKQSEITALAAMDEHERQEIVDRAVAGEKVSAAKLPRDCTTSAGPKQSGCDYPEVPNANLRRADTLKVKDDGTSLQVRDPDGAALGEVAGRRDIEDVFDGIEPECASKPNALKQAWITASEPERLAFVDALAELPAKRQRRVAEIAKKGEPVSAFTAFSTCDPEASKTSDGTGKEPEPAPRLDPRAWSMSTAQQREVFVKAVGRSEIEDAFHAIESGYALMRGLNTLNQAWSSATESDRWTFYRETFPANCWHRFRT